MTAGMSGVRWFRGLAAAVVACAIPAAAVAMPDAKRPPVTSSARPVAIFGPDDRTDVPEKFSALEGKVGMLYEQSTQTLCTAFCVGEGIIATAAHCLFQPKSNQLPNLNEVVFRLSYGTTQKTSGIHGRNTPFVKNSIAVGTTQFNNEPPLSAPKDWAVVKLERPICSFGAIKVQTMSVPEIIEKAQEKKVFQVAYHWDYKHWQLAYSQPCRVARDFDQIKWRFIRQHFLNSDELLLHTCDTGGASSGSPVLLDTAGSGRPGEPPIAVAINVGTYTRTRILLRQGHIVKRLKPDIIANTGVNATAFKKVIDAMEKADLIASRPDMLKLQTELQARGFYSGTLDGNLGRSTRAAIVAFEAYAAMTPTGLPTRDLLRKFGEDRIKPSHTLSTGTGTVDPVDPPAPPKKAARPDASQKTGGESFDPFFKPVQ